LRVLLTVRIDVLRYNYPDKTRDVVDPYSPAFLFEELRHILWEADCFYCLSLRPIVFSHSYLGVLCPGRMAKYASAIARVTVLPSTCMDLYRRNSIVGLFPIANAVVEVSPVIAK